MIKSVKDKMTKLRCVSCVSLRGNRIVDRNATRSIGFVSKTLRVLILSENQVMEMSDYRLSILMLVPQLERLDKDPVTPEEKMEARERVRVKKKRLIFYFFFCLCVCVFVAK